MVTIGDQEFSMDGYLCENYDIGKKAVKQDWDMTFVVDGGEGSGKSVCAMQGALYCDPTFNIKRIAFTPQQFKSMILGAEKYQAIVYDEAYTGLSSRSAMSMINRTLISMLAEIRQKNLFIFVVMPCFFDLDKYVALWRSRALIHVYTGEGFQRGFFAFYNIDKKKELYCLGKKLYNYSKPFPNFRGRFVNHYTVDPVEYKKMKLDALNEKSKVNEQEEFNSAMRDILFRRLISDKFLDGKIPNIVKARILGVSEVHFYRLLKDFNELKEFK